MRHLSLAAAILVLAACGSGERSTQAPTSGKGGTPTAAKPKAESAPAARSDPASATPAADAKPAAELKPADAPAVKVINTICPVTGLAVDPAIPPIEVLVEVVHPPQVLLIGVSDADAGKRVAANPERFAAAARNNRVARDPRAPAAGAGQR